MAGYTISCPQLPQYSTGTVQRLQDLVTRSCEYVFSHSSLLSSHVFFSEEMKRHLPLYSSQPEGQQSVGRGTVQGLAQPQMLWGVTRNGPTPFQQTLHAQHLLQAWLQPLD